MTNNESTKKSSSRIILAAILIATVVIVAVAGVYCLVLPNLKAEKSPEPVTNFSEGAWANYSLSIYNPNGTVTSSGYMMANTTAGTYNGSDCWVYVENVTYTSTDGSNVNDVITYYLDKSTYTNLHQTECITSNGEVAFDGEFNSGDNGYMDTIAVVRNMTVLATDKAITVPAGTFSTTERTGNLTYVSESATYTLTSWASKDVPTWGIVKYQFHLDGALFSEYLLESYGS